MRFPRFFSVPLVLALGLLLPCLSGCGRRVATVHGMVSLEGRPVTVGVIVFHGKDFAGRGAIQSDGTYRVKDAPVGKVTITVETPKPPSEGVLAPPEPPPELDTIPGAQGEEREVEVVPVPEIYNKMETSPLKYTVKPGKHKHNIELEP